MSHCPPDDIAKLIRNIQNSVYTLGLDEARQCRRGKLLEVLKPVKEPTSLILRSTSPAMVSSPGENHWCVKGISVKISSFIRNNIIFILTGIYRSSIEMINLFFISQNLKMRIKLGNILRQFKYENMNVYREFLHSLFSNIIRNPLESLGKSFPFYSTASIYLPFSIS